MVRGRAALPSWPAGVVAAGPELYRRNAFRVGGLKDEGEKAVWERPAGSPADERRGIAVHNPAVPRHAGLPAWPDSGRHCR